MPSTSLASVCPCQQGLTSPSQGASSWACWPHLHCGIEQCPLLCSVGCTIWFGGNAQGVVVGRMGTVLHGPDLPPSSPATSQTSSVPPYCTHLWGVMAVPCLWRVAFHRCE